MPDNRNLTDEDVKAIVEKLKTDIARDIYAEAGRGLWAWVRKAFFTLLIVFAVYSISGGKVVVNLPEVLK